MVEEAQGGLAGGTREGGVKSNDTGGGRDHMPPETARVFILLVSTLPLCVQALQVWQCTGQSGLKTLAFSLDLWGGYYAGKGSLKRCF